MYVCMYVWCIGQKTVYHVHTYVGISKMIMIVENLTKADITFQTKKYFVLVIILIVFVFVS